MLDHYKIISYALSRCAAALIALALMANANPAPSAPIKYGFLWHMHQPIYYPYESVVQSQNNSRYSFDLYSIFNNRSGPYTTWPKDAVQSGTSLPHLGAQVSFTGSLVENLNVLQSNGIGGGTWNNWSTGYAQGMNLKTTLNNPRLDIVAFGYHHPLMPLLDKLDMQMQIRLHKYVFQQQWPGYSYSKGMFPAENAFAERMIPALVAEGIDWVMVDNIHFDRACVNYPHTNASNLFAPNKSDQLNPDPAANGGAWVQLQNVWAPSKVSAPFGYQPHNVQYVDPNSGAVTSMIAVPTARYEGNEDARGGYGAFLYGTVMAAYLPYNNDASHPMFVILHHDGDNYGGGTDSYYHSNFQNMVSWDSGDSDYECYSAQDYLQQYPVASNDIIHVESGSWSGADNGDPEFKKWLGDPNSSGWSPDRNSWAVMTAARNRVYHAEQVAPTSNMGGILNGNGSNTEKAWHFLLAGQASDHWYWDGSGEPWDSNVTRACNQAVTYADPVIAGQPDNTPPAVFIPQRNPYNPGGYEWGSSPEPSDFEVWTYVYDVSGLGSVQLKWRTDNDGQNPIASTQNETYSGGSEVSAWNTVAMTTRATPSIPANILPATYRATEYYGNITGQHDVLIDYYVEATDAHGNIYKSDIQHVYVGTTVSGGGGGGGGPRVTLVPAVPTAGQQVMVQYNPVGGPIAGTTAAKMHYGINNWSAGSINDVSMTSNSTSQRWETTVTLSASATQFDCVFNNGAASPAWDNNSSADWHFLVNAGVPPPAPPWTIDGNAESTTSLLAQNGSGLKLWARMQGTVLYVATQCATSSPARDHFIYITDSLSSTQGANWAKSGTIVSWDAFLANEASNNYNSWFNSSGSPTTSYGATSASGSPGGVLEGSIDLSQLYSGGPLPPTLYIAAAEYGTNNGDALVPSTQVPASTNSDTNLDAAEFLVFSTGLPVTLSYLSVE
ncbi:MAG: hypothetical protein K1X53_06265 [Candidatus Sumerlaeaceae bacterium]|nr:hypothetical protein [Candidatus Sumerlaeaceae bacterium]